MESFRGFRVISVDLANHPGWQYTSIQLSKRNGLGA